MIDRAGQPGAAGYLLGRLLANAAKAFGFALLALLNAIVCRLDAAKKALVRAWRSCGYLYQIPRLTAEKQARVKYLATGEKAKSGSAKGTPRSTVYGTGLKGRQVKTAATRAAATAVEQAYETTVAARAAGKRTVAAVVTPVNPLAPQAAAWEAALAEQHARILAQAPRRPVARKKKVTPAEA